jgi:hypothetical protein
MTPNDREADVATLAGKRIPSLTLLASMFYSVQGSMWQSGVALPDEQALPLFLSTVTYPVDMARLEAMIREHRRWQEGE